MIEPTPQLSRRDYFAAMAMHASYLDSSTYAREIGGAMNSPDEIATDAVDFADALIAELDRTTPQSDA